MARHEKSSRVESSRHAVGAVASAHPPTYLSNICTTRRMPALALTLTLALALLLSSRQAPSCWGPRLATAIKSRMGATSPRMGRLPREDGERGKEEEKKEEERTPESREPRAESRE